jgi:fibronectin-binding autotransporter adhesin
MNTSTTFKFNSLTFASLALCALIFATNARGAAKFHSTTAGSLNWANTGGSSLWATTSGGTYNQGWSTGDTAVFEGTGGAVTLSGAATTGPGSVSVPGMSFTADGYSISASSAQTLNVGNAGQASFITVGAGRTATIGNYVKLTKATTGHGELDILGGGTLVVGSGLGVLGGSGAALDLSATASGSGNVSFLAGDTTLQISSDATVKYHSSLVVGGSATYLNGGTITVNGGAFSVGTGNLAANLILGNDATQAKAATITLNSGSLTVPAAAGTPTGGLRFGSSGTTWTRTFNLNGGTLTTFKTYVGSAGAASVFNFNGGTLKPLIATTVFMEGLARANVRNNGAIVNLSGSSITINQALLHSNVGGDNATDGGLTLTNTGSAATLTLGGANTYTGPTVVSAGTLALGASASLDGGSSVSIGAGATFDVSAMATYTWGASAGLTATGSSLAAASIKGGTTISLNSRPATLNFTPAAFLGDSTHPALTVTAGTLSVGGSTMTVVNNGGSPLGAGDYTLINVSGGGAISGTPTLDTSSGVGAGTGMAVNTSASLVYSGGSLVLRVTSALPPTTTTIALGSGWSSTSTYGDALQFDVSVTGASPAGTVTVRDGGLGGTPIGSGTLSGGVATITVNPLTSLAAGSHNNIVAVYSGDVNNQGSVSSPLATQTVGPKPLTVPSAAAVGKCYDGTPAGATITGTLNGVVGSDVVTLNGTGTFASAGPGPGIAVTSTSTLGGAAAANYSLTQPTGLAADIVTTATWNVASGGSWEPAGNWLNSIVGAASGNTADFSAVNITADATVTLSAPRTIGNLVFADPDTNSVAGWTLTGSTLTLAGTTPTITVNALAPGKSAVISSILAGSSGLTKSGNGTLNISVAVNTYTGGTRINGGTLIIGADARLGAVPVSVDPANIIIDGGKLFFNFNGSTVVNRGMQINSGNATIDGATGLTGNIGIGGPISGVGALTNAYVPTTTSVLVTGGNQHTYAGGTTLLPGSSTVAQTTSDGTGVNLTKGPFGTGTLTLAGGSFRATSAGGPYDFGNAVTFAADTTINSAGLAFTLSGPVTLTGNRTLTQNSANSMTISGSIGEDVPGRALTKAGTGAGALILTAANSYSGNTTISAGTLALSGSGSINNSPNIAIASGAIFDVSAVSGGYVLGTGQKLSGEGTVSGAATINGTLAPGASIGTLNFSSGLTFTSGSTNHIELGNSLAADKAAATGAVTYAGKLKLERAAGATLANGTYDLFDGASFSGSFTQLELVNWDATKRVNQSGLTTDGSIVLSANAAPVAVNLAAGVVQGGTVVIPVIGGKHSATDADGDALTVSVATQPVNGSASSGASSVTYVASGGTGTNTFTYTVTDPFGATDTKTVTVIVSSPLGFNQVSAGVDGGNAILTYLGIPGTNYALEITHDLPATNWTPVISNTASPLGYLYFTNPISLPPTNDYYRTRYVP